MKCSRTKGLKRSGGEIYEALKKLSHKPTDQLDVVCWQEVEPLKPFVLAALFLAHVSAGGGISSLCLLRQLRFTEAELLINVPPGPFEPTSDRLTDLHMRPVSHTF